MVNQKEAVFQATMAVLKDRGIAFDQGTDIQEIITKDLKESIHEIVCEGFRQGQVEFRDTESNKKKLLDRQELSNYVSGLVNNWFRKDKRLNGGETYAAKNPGSRQSDVQLKNLKLLKVKFAGTEKEALIDVAIAERQARVEAERAKKVEVDMSQVPAELRKMLGM